MKNIFLSSSFAEVSELLADFIPEKIKGKKITFIPTASIHEEINFYVDAGKQALETFGFVIDELEISTASKNEITNKIKKNDYIYVTGGNTFFLLQELKRTETDIVLIDQVNAGKTYIGESAGSIVLSPNINYIKEMDDYQLVTLKSYDSLGLIDFYPLPHYKNFPFEECTEKIASDYNNQIKLFPFNNTQAIIVQGDSVEVLNK